MTKGRPGGRCALGGGWTSILRERNGGLGVEEGQLIRKQNRCYGFHPTKVKCDNYNPNEAEKEE